MPNTTPMLRKHPDGLIYTVDGSEATIVGCTALNLTCLEIPAVLSDGDQQYRVTAVGESAFAYMSALQSVSFPETLRCIAHGAFEATGLTEVTLPAQIESAQPYAFFGCERLTRVQLPVNTVFTLADQVFGGCTALKRENIANCDYHSDEDAARAGLPEANRVAVSAAAQGQVILPEANRSPAEKLLEKAAALEKENRLGEAAATYLQAHEQRKQLRAIAEVEKQFAALNAISEAEYRLAVLLKFGLVPAKNPDGTPRPTAQELLQLVVDTAGLPDAAYHLGDIYAGGYGVPADPAAAIRLLKSAADANVPHARACLDLGYIYLNGTLAAPSRQTAAHYFSKCASLESPYADIARTEADALPRC